MTQTTNLKLNMFDASDKFSNDELNENWQKIDDGVSLTGSAEGTSIQITDAANNCGLYSLYIEGESVQNGTPTPDAPIEIDSIGDSGSLTITTDNGGETSTTATITSALPLCSVGNVKDEFIFNADGTAKIIKRFEKLILNGSESWSESPTRETAIKRQLLYLSKPCANNSNSVLTNAVCSHYQLRTGNGTFTRQIGISVVTNFSTEQTPLFIYDDRYNSEGVTSDFKAWLSENPVTLIYELRYPEEINLTAEETAALLALETFEDLTNIFNSDNAQMSVEYWRNEDVGSLLTSISRNTNSRLTALENAILGG